MRGEARGDGSGWVSDLTDERVMTMIGEMLRCARAMKTTLNRFHMPYNTMPCELTRVYSILRSDLYLYTPGVAHSAPFDLSKASIGMDVASCSFDAHSASSRVCVSVLPSACASITASSCLHTSWSGFEATFWQ